MLVILAICVAASANFPVLILSLFWRRFNTGGVIGGMTVGLVSSVVLAMIGPAMRGADALWPLVNPTIVSMPLGFLGAVVGGLLYGRDAENEKRFDNFLIRVHTGVSPEIANTPAARRDNRDNQSSRVRCLLAPSTMSNPLKR